MITIKFRDDKTPLEIDAETIGEAVKRRSLMGLTCAGLTCAGLT